MSGLLLCVGVLAVGFRLFKTITQREIALNVKKQGKIVCLEGDYMQKYAKEAILHVKNQAETVLRGKITCKKVQKKQFCM